MKLSRGSDEHLNIKTNDSNDDVTGRLSEVCVRHGL